MAADNDKALANEIRSELTPLLEQACAIMDKATAADVHVAFNIALDPNTKKNRVIEIAIHQDGAAMRRPLIIASVMLYVGIGMLTMAYAYTHPGPGYKPWHSSHALSHPVVSFVAGVVWPSYWLGLGAILAMDSI